MKQTKDAKTLHDKVRRYLDDDRCDRSVKEMFFECLIRMELELGKKIERHEFDVIHLFYEHGVNVGTAIACAAIAELPFEEMPRKPK